MTRRTAFARTACAAWAVLAGITVADVDGGVLGEPDDVATRIRAVLADLSQRRVLQQAESEDLRALLQENLRLFELAGSPEQSVAPSFGDSGAGDYAMCSEALVELQRIARIDPGGMAAETVITLVESLMPVVNNDVEWSESLDLAVGEFALAAPKAYVLYLAGIHSEERDRVLGQLNPMCETEQGEQLRASLRDLLKQGGLDARVLEAVAEVNEFLSSRVCTGESN